MKISGKMGRFSRGYEKIKFQAVLNGKETQINNCFLSIDN